MVLTPWELGVLGLGGQRECELWPEYRLPHPRMETSGLARSR